MYFSLYSLIFANIAFLVVVRLYCWLTCGKCRSSRHLVGKVVIVTGANAGIGFETAKDMAERGARVILACRSETRGTAARDAIIKLTGNTDVHFRRLDLASLVSVRAFASNILSTEKRLDILINNAGIYTSEYQKTEDDLLLCMQINHFGPFLLTNLLLPLVKSSAPSRIINVSSLAHQYGKLDLEDLNWEKRAGQFNQHRVYADSKLCNVLTTVELDRLLEGTGVTVNSLHPGAVATNIVNVSINSWLKTFLEYAGRLVTKTPWEGAQTTIYLAVSPELCEVSGRYFRDCFEVRASKAGQDKELARQLWAVSEKLVKLKSEKS